MAFLPVFWVLFHAKNALILLPQRRKKTVDIEPSGSADSLLDRRDLAGLAGILIVCFSIGFIYPPAGGIVFGLLVLLAAFLA